MKRTILCSLIIILSLNYCGAQLKTPYGEKVVVPKAGASVESVYGQWVTVSHTTAMYTKLSPVNVKKAIDTYKRFLSVNNVTRPYTDQSTWPDDMDKSDPYEMYRKLLIGYGELSWVTEGSGYIFALKATDENILVMATKIKE